jgi:transcriptional regulator with XRE-family HTH domain
MTLSGLACAALRLLEHTPAAVPRTKRSLSVSASYISLIENGHKVPDAAVAWALARALGDDPELYAAWVRARKRSDLASALAAAQMLERRLAEIRAAQGSDIDPALPARPRRRRVHAKKRNEARSPSGTAPARLRLPIIPEGLDPGEGVRPSCEILEWRGLDESELPPEWLGRLDRPFGFRLSEAGVTRAPDVLFPGDYAIVLRDFASLSSREIYAVRHDGHVIVSQVLWNGNALLLLPAQGASDFIVIESCNEQRLRQLILGRVFTLGSDQATKGSPIRRT